MSVEGATAVGLGLSSETIREGVQMSRNIRDPRSGLVWLAVRLWVGWEYLGAGCQKTFGSESSAWWNSSTGVHGFLTGSASALSTTGATHPFRTGTAG